MSTPKQLTSSEVMLKSASAWSLAYCEETTGWPGQYTLIWRSEEFHGKIGSFIKSKRAPTKARIAKELKKELLRRFESPLRCDAKRVAYAWLTKQGQLLPLECKQTLKLLQDALYDLDNKIGNEFWSTNGPRLFMTSTHGWILAEIAEIRCLVSSLSQTIQRGAA